MITKIKARGHMVEITSDEHGPQLISRREALVRAQAVLGMDRDSEWLCEALINAANEAKINEDGKGYSSANLELWKSTAAEEARKAH